MNTEGPMMIQCGEGWCIETPAGMEGPMDSRQDAAIYLNLLKRVDAARNEMACEDSDI
ncbi:MAG: hypothetical protein PVG50_06635 [Thiohalophilus sp.]|jgi:hypothetical protein